MKSGGKRKKNSNSASHSESSMELGELKIDGPSTTKAAAQAKLAINRFAAFSSYDNDEEIPDDQPAKTPAKEKVVKPYIPDVTNIKALNNRIATVLGEGVECTLKATRNINIRVMTPNKESFSALKAFLKPRDERAYQVVIKGLYYSTDLEEIRERLRQHGHVARDIYNPT